MFKKEIINKLEQKSKKLEEDLKYAEEVCGGVMGICFKCWKPIYGNQKIAVTKDHLHTYHENENDCFKRIEKKV